MKATKEIIAKLAKFAENYSSLKKNGFERDGADLQIANETIGWLEKVAANVEGDALGLIIVREFVGKQKLGTNNYYRYGLTSKQAWCVARDFLAFASDEAIAEAGRIFCISELKAEKEAEKEAEKDENDQTIVSAPKVAKKAQKTAKQAIAEKEAKKEAEAKAIEEVREICQVGEYVGIKGMGKGRVYAADEKTVIIDFSGVGYKTYIVKYLVGRVIKCRRPRRNLGSAALQPFEKLKKIYDASFGDR